MAYKRKTYDSWQLWVNGDDGWKLKLTVLSQRELYQKVREHKGAKGPWDIKLVYKRVKIAA